MLLPLLLQGLLQTLHGVHLLLLEAHELRPQRPQHGHHDAGRHGRRGAGDPGHGGATEGRRPDPGRVGAGLPQQRLGRQGPHVRHGAEELEPSKLSKLVKRC